MSQTSDFLGDDSQRRCDARVRKVIGRRMQREFADVTDEMVPQDFLELLERASKNASSRYRD